MARKIRTRATQGRPATPKEAEEILDRLLEEGIKPVAGGLAKFAAHGVIPIVVFEPGGETQRVLKLTFHGWKAGMRLIGITREEFARSFGTLDHVTEAWGSRIRPQGDVPIFMFVHDGTLLINFIDGKGYSLEPGSMDEECEARRQN
jgi:hypothetical protein